MTEFRFKLDKKLHKNQENQNLNLKSIYVILALTRKICGILSKKSQKLALSNYYRTCLSKQPYFAIFVAAFLISHKFCRFRLVYSNIVDIDRLHNYLKHLTFACS